MDHTHHDRKRGIDVREKLAEDSPMPDDFAACRIERGEDIRDLFTKTFFCGKI